MNVQNRVIIVFFTVLLITPFMPTLTIAAANVPSAQTLQGAANLQLPLFVAIACNRFWMEGFPD